MKSISEVKQDVLKCTRCGNCQYYCPSYSVSRLESSVARGRLQLIKRVLEDQTGSSETFVRRINQCLLCGNCTQNCPAGICTEDVIEKMREQCVTAGGPQKTLEAAARNIASVGNITGDERENRLLWFENMEEGTVKTDVPAKYLYFAGCVSTLYPSSYSIPQSFAKLLNKAGLDWSVMGGTESCCSYPLMIGGMPESAAQTIKKNVRDVAAAGAESLVTTCPSCYHMWKDVYPAISPDMPDIKVFHAVQLLSQLVSSGALKPVEKVCAVTYHDPCDLGRKSGVYDEPREILNAIPGVRLSEMKFNRENSFCCGGGGNLEMHDATLSGKVAQQRIGHAIEAGAEIIVTSCQQCKRTLAGGARQKRAKIKVMDLCEFVLSAVE